MKKTIEIEDSLQERVDMAIAEVKEALLKHLNDDEPSSCPDMGDLDYDGSIHEIVDGCVPVYTYEIKCTWFLNQSELEQAYENAGVGDNPMENDGMAAIYFYIMDAVQSWFNDNAEDVFGDWKAGVYKEDTKKA